MGQFYSTAGTSLEPNFPDLPTESIHGHDYTFYLPDENLGSIFRFLNSSDRKNCSLVCKRWLRIEGQSRHRLSLNAQDEKLLPFLPSLFTRFDSLTKLSLRSNRKFTAFNDDALILVSIRCRNLTRLKLSGRFQLTDVSLSIFATNCKNIRKFSCSSCNFGAKAINGLLNHSSTLEELSVKSLRGVIDSTELIVPGAAASSLKSIMLKDLVNGHCFVPLIMGSKNLRTLKIIRCHGNWDEHFKMIGDANGVPGLIEIHLERIQVSDYGVSAFSKCMNLEILHLIKTWDCSNLGLACIAEHCKGLKKLHIDGWRINRIGDEGLIAIAKQCFDLQELVLIGVNPTCLSLSLLSSNCVKLERLALCGSTVGDVEIACIAAKCKSLKKLCIKGCPISNAGIESLAWGCPNLTKIKVKKCIGVTGGVSKWLLEKRRSLTVNWDVDEIDQFDASSSDAGSAQEIVPEFRQIIQVNAVEAPVNSVNRLPILRTTLGLLAGRNLMACTFRRWSNTDSTGNL